MYRYGAIGSPCLTPVLEVKERGGDSDVDCIYDVEGRREILARLMRCCGYLSLVRMWRMELRLR